VKKGGSVTYMGSDHGFTYTAFSLGTSPMGFGARL
jgi:hypothetical protein